MMKGSMMFPRNGTDASGRRCEMSVNAGCIRISPLCDTDPCLARRPDSGSGLRRLRRILSAFCPPPSVPVSLLPHRQTAGAVRRGMRSGKRPGCISAGRKRSEWPAHAQFLHLFPNIPVFCDRSRSWSASVGPLRSGGRFVGLVRFAAVRCGPARFGIPRPAAARRPAERSALVRCRDVGRGAVIGTRHRFGIRTDRRRGQLRAQPVGNLPVRMRSR